MDKVSEIQQELNKLSEQFCKSLVTLSREAKPEPFSRQLKIKLTLSRHNSIASPSTDKVDMHVADILGLYKNVSKLIDELPAHDQYGNADTWNESLAKWNTENAKTVEELDDKIREGEAFASKLQSLITRIVDKEQDVLQ